MKKIKTSFTRVDARGTFNEYINSDQGWKAVNGGIMKKGAVLGNHYHKENVVLFFVAAGTVRIVSRDVRKKGKKKQTITLNSNEGALIYPYETHTCTFVEKSSFLLLKANKFSQSKKDLFAEPV